MTLLVMNSLTISPSETAIGMLGLDHLRDAVEPLRIAVHRHRRGDGAHRYGHLGVGEPPLGRHAPGDHSHGDDGYGRQGGDHDAEEVAADVPPCRADGDAGCSKECSARFPYPALQGFDDIVANLPRCRVLPVFTDMERA
ncbi:hypothetical protein [Azospirillum sp. sgz302134]